MSQRNPDPCTLPEWRALHREASLVSQLIGAGVTALGRASYGSGLGEYYTAFFGLSIGIERLAKLILVADHAIDNAGELPSQKVVRNFGHDLKKLCDKADQIALKHKLTLDHPRPTEPICWKAVECLTSFADASRGRYANFEAIGNPAFDPATEPVNKWWAEVVEPILDKHYRGKDAELRVKRGAMIVDAMIGDHSAVFHIAESGQAMDDLAVASERTGQTEWAQKYGRFYALCVVRWLAGIFYELTNFAVYQQGVAALSGHYEFFDGYQAEDHFLRNRKIWPLK
ncbi:MAG: hypothetical protein POH28_06655 [Acidocella sp.]|nr:hypothetical protein [Acidocella sp.]